MKREIKFRAKEIDTGNWIFGGVSFAADGKAFIVNTGKDRLGYITMMREIDINTLEQYTGLKDKKGNEIYEGDILRGTITSAWYKAVLRCEVRWVRDSWISVEHNPSGERTHKLMFAKDCEVIGNIYDNKDLLKIRDYVH